MNKDEKSKKMKIVQVNCVYDYGSTGKLTKQIHTGLLKRGFESVVLYGRRQRTEDKFVYKTCTELEAKAWNLLSRITGYPYSVAPFGTRRLLRILKKEKPDIVQLQCLNGFFVNIYELLEYLKKEQITTVLTLHAEFMYTGGCSHSLECEQWKSDTGCGTTMCPQYHKEIHNFCRDKSGKVWRKMKCAFKGMEDISEIVSVSPWLERRAKQSSILKNERHCVILNGIDTEVFHKYDTEDLRKQYEKNGRKIVFHATPMFSADKEHIKGGYYVLKLAEMMPEMLFLIAGQYETNIKVPDNVLLLGQITDQQRLARYYSMADITLLTSKRETFSMVCAESLCCGTPVVGFKAGAPELIAIPEYSAFFEHGDINGIKKFIEDNDFHEKKENICKKAHKIYAVDAMIDKYINLYEQIRRDNGEKNDE